MKSLWELVEFLEKRIFYNKKDTPIIMNGKVVGVNLHENKVLITTSMSVARWFDFEEYDFKSI